MGMSAVYVIRDGLPEVRAEGDEDITALYCGDSYRLQGTLADIQQVLYIWQAQVDAIAAGGDSRFDDEDDDNRFGGPF